MGERRAGVLALSNFLVSTAILVAAGVYAARGEWPWHSPAPHIGVQDLLATGRDTLRAGESIADLLARQGVRDFALSPESARDLFEPRRLRPGTVFTLLRRDPDSLPLRVLFRAGPDRRIVLEPTARGWLAMGEPIAWRTEAVVLGGPIATTLLDALQAGPDDVGLTPEDRVRLAWDLADVFAWQVDFSRELRSGDTFRAVVERLVSEDGDVRYGRLLAADMEVRGRRWWAYRWSAPDGTSAFYDADGRSLRRAFLLAPLSFRRISSRMNGARHHPVLGTVRRHEGIDYAALPGTPVMAAGDGVIARREWSEGYGNLVEIRHPHGVVTRYGHLQEFAKGIAAGARVSQGQSIGSVGSTGLATGPHLHYEFRMNGVAQDPRTADLGAEDPVTLAEQRTFEQERGRLLALLGTADTRYAAEFSTPPEGRVSAGASF